jgi:hypothetical protein
MWTLRIQLSVADLFYIVMKQREITAMIFDILY